MRSFFLVVSCLTRDLIFLATVLPNALAIRADANESITIPARLFPCLPACSQVLEGDAASETERALCRAAQFEASQCSYEWSGLLKMGTKSSCGGSTDAAAAHGGECEGQENEEMIKKIFGNDGCAVDDLCSFAAAKLSAWEVACRGRIRRACPHELHSGSALELLQSLLCPCSTIASAASRSGAVIQKTHDGLYIVKRIKQSEMPQLLVLLDQLPTERSLLAQWSYVDTSRHIVIMPNAFHSDTYGLHAGWINRGGDPAFQSCQTKIDIRLEKDFDIKPLPITSAERRSVLELLVQRQWRLQDMSAWNLVTDTLLRSLGFLERWNLVDYSLLLAFFSTEAAEDSRCSPYMELTSKSSQCIVTPDCAPGVYSHAMAIEKPHRRGAVELSPDVGHLYGQGPPAHGPLPSYDPRLFGSGLGPMSSFHRNSASFMESSKSPQGSCEMLCVTVVDYLMEFSLVRQLESAMKQHRWDDYATKTKQMWYCLGDLTQPGCEEYLQLGCEELARRAPDAGPSSPWCGDVSLEKRVDEGEGELEGRKGDGDVSGRDSSSSEAEKHNVGKARLEFPTEPETFQFDMDF
eukprot:TRINITY_DN39336_c0_g1_i1.p1 TRINITY_DN39336_c0_g1~~TRINITY_DN39336_c0_g1_i1.p1  ORF type:complete len:578 (-),score=79.09 TRINITY_DN39336_c0_g1_i1:33-1766(-)